MRSGQVCAAIGVPRRVGIGGAPASRWIRGLGWTLGLAACAALAGCTTFNAGSAPAGKPGARAMQHPLLPGIPIPEGFALDDKESVHSSSGNVRVAKCVFKGSLRPQQTVEFYKENMPPGGWTLRSESFDQGIYDEHYESDREECYVRVGRSGFSTRVTLDVKPKPVGVPEAGKRKQPPSPTP